MWKAGDRRKRNAAVLDRICKKSEQTKIGIEQHLIKQDRDFSFI